VTSTREKPGTGSKSAAEGETPLQSFAVTAPGLAPFAANELSSLGLAPTEVEGAGVSFESDLAGVARANHELRTASRILVRVDEFRASNFHELEKRSARIDWSRWLSPGCEVSLRVTCRKSRLYHSGAVAERVAKELAQASVRVGVPGTGSAAAPAEEWEGEGESQLLVVRLLHDRCTISIDSSGALLHQRGYRLAAGKAPLRETLGAALLLASGWTPGTPLVDPFCGSGTIAIEAAMLARRLAPARNRRFAFERWPGADASMMQRVRRDAAARERPSVDAPIVASDRDAGVIDAARENAERAGVAGDITFVVRAVSSLTVPASGSTGGAVVTNPPYGVRVGEARTLRNLYARTGDVLRAVCPGWRVAIVVSDRRLPGELRLRLEDRVRTSNGGLPVTFATGEVPALSEGRAFTAPDDSIG
jgi:putative N6-adenine-specific DNA methylase